MHTMLSLSYDNPVQGCCVRIPSPGVPIPESSSGTSREKSKPMAFATLHTFKLICLVKISRAFFIRKIF